MGSKEGLAVSLERLQCCTPVFAQGRCSLSEKQKRFPRIERAHLFHGRCASWVVAISCQCREEGEICVSRLQLAVASTKFLVIFRKLDLSLEVLGMYNFLLSGAFQPFSFASCCVGCRVRCGEERVGLLTVRVERFQCPVPRNPIIDGAQCCFGMCGSKRIFNLASLVSPGFIKSFLCTGCSSRLVSAELLAAFFISAQRRC